MKFGPVSLDEAEGGVLVHSLILPDGALKKGSRLGPEQIERLRAAGLTETVVAHPEPGDVLEDEAARAVADALGDESISVERAVTGRANLFARRAGVLLVLRAAVDAANRIDESITVATLPEHAAVEAGRMVATVKIIPYAAPRAALDKVLEGLRREGPTLKVASFRPMSVGMIATVLPGTPEKVLEKTVRTMRGRLDFAGARLAVERRAPHEAAALAGALKALRAEDHGLIVVFGASAIADRRDVIPAAIEAAGGAIEHFGMPVDPGNLLLIGRLDGVPVIGAPGCARSPKENGFDWVLHRLLAGLDVTREDVTGMGVGGLLMEIVTRPQPRQGPPEPAHGHPPNVAAIVLAAGRSQRMGGPNKMLATLRGEPFVRIAAKAAIESRADPVVVVTGHQAEKVAAALGGLDVAVIHNPDFAQGLSTSLKAGLAVVPEEAQAVLICLADMPAIDAEMMDRLIAAFDPVRDASIIVATAEGERGNPTLWPRRFFGQLMAATGDSGGRAILMRHPEAVLDVEIGAPARLDADTPEALAAIGAEPRAED